MMFNFLLLIDVVIFLLLGAFALSLFFKDKEKSKVKFVSLNEETTEFIDETKQLFIEKESLDKPKKKKKKDAPKKNRRVFVLNFTGSGFADEVEDLRKEISAILLMAKPGVDEVYVHIDSPGGTVSGYGLVAAELGRFKSHSIKLTAMVDRVAASGGYMAAVVADKIIAAPFAYIGSVGVVSEFPNFHRLINKIGVEWKTYTAGESKRDVGQYGKITPAAEKRHNKKLKDIHLLFQNHIASHRKQVNAAKIATGEVWTAQEAVKLKLVDQLAVSDDVIAEQILTANVYKVETEHPQSFIDNVLGSVSTVAVKHFKGWMFNLDTENLLKK
jgi:serine protease SohB